MDTKTTWFGFPRAAWIHYGIAITSVVIATFFRLALDPLFGEKFPYITFIFAIVANAWYSGLGPSMVTMILGFLSAFFLFASPRGSFQVSGLDGQVGAVSYIITGVSTIFFFESIRATEKRASAIAAKLTAQQTVLENEIHDRKKAQEATRFLLQRLVNAQEDERRRISRELHDQCGQDLTALRLELKLLEESLHGRVDTAPRLRALCLHLDRVADEVHHLALKLRPAILDELGLAMAVLNYVDNWKILTGICVDCELRGWEEFRVREDLETAFYRVLQEALTNVAKHASASAVNLVLLLDVNGASMIVEDDGCGFDVSPEFNGAGPVQHLGLLSMRERMIAIGGSLEVESAPGSGSTVYARVPAASVVA